MLKYIIHPDHPNNPLIVSLLLLAFVISKTSLNFSMDNRQIICHVILSMTPSLGKWPHEDRESRYGKSNFSTAYRKWVIWDLGDLGE